MVTVARGDIWLVNLDPTVGSEIQKSRPCVVISPPEMHDHLRTTIVAPMATGSRPAPFRVPISHGGKDGLILLDQLRAVDKTRLVTKFGAVNQQTLDLTLNTLQVVFSS
jgi:mRNA interferase MazF